jgi:hypothetical protein
MPLPAALNQWEREVQLYIGLRHLPVFRLRRLRKAFSGWRRAVASGKAAGARVALAGATGLFALSPVFHGPLRRVWGLCCDVAAMRLHAIQPEKVRFWTRGQGAHG